MSEQKSLEQTIKDQAEEISELKKKLSDRSQAFNGNLLSRADQKYNQICKNLGESIVNTLGQDYVHTFIHLKIALKNQSGFYGGGGWIVYLSEEDRKKVTDLIADVEMKKFQESLDNFSWAVQNR